MLALKAAVMAGVEIDGVTYAPPAVVAAAIGRSEMAVRRWEQRGLIRRHVNAAVVLVCVEDAQREHDERQAS